MTSPTSAGPSATPIPSRTRLLHWSVAAPLSAAAGVGSAVLGVLADVPLLGVAGALVAAVPAVLAARRVPALHAEQARARARADQAERALDLAGRGRVARAAEQAVNALQEPPATVDLTRPAKQPAAGVETAVVPAQQPAPHLVRHVAASSTRVAASAPATAPAVDAQVDTAELQRIWDLGEAARTRTGRGRRVRVGAEVDALPDRPRKTAGQRRRARHRA